MTNDTPLPWNHKLIAKKRIYLGKGWAKKRLLLQVAVLLSAVGPAAGFAQSDNDPPPFYIIDSFKILGTVRVATTEDLPELWQHEQIKESLSWRSRRSELIRKVRWSANGKTIERSETPSGLDSIKQESFEIKRRARTDKNSAEINVSATVVTSDDGITIEGLQSITLGPFHDVDARSNANMMVSFTVMAGAKGIVRIFGCDVFAKDHFQNQPGFQVDGENCSFLLQESHAGQPLFFIAKLEADAEGQSGENNEGVVLAKPFKITIGKECDEGKSYVKVSGGDRTGPFKDAYQECAQRIVEAAKCGGLCVPDETAVAFPGLLKIGGPAKRCVNVGGRRSKAEWYQATINKHTLRGSCQVADFHSVDGEGKASKYNSTPDTATQTCSERGPIWTREQIYAATPGNNCVLNGTRYKVSDHHDGFAVDLFVYTGKGKGPKPTGCTKEGGDQMAKYFRDNATQLGIENVIWDEQSANAPSMNVHDYSEKVKHPHYNHVHVDCKN